MTSDMLGSIQSMFGGVINQNVSAYLGESEQATRAGVGTAVTALLAKFVQGSSQPGGARELLGAVNRSGLESGSAASLAAGLAERSGFDSLLSSGQGLLTSLLGSRTNALSQAVAQTTGVKSSSALALLGLAAPVLFGFLRRQVTEHRLDESGFRTLLSGQRRALEQAGLDRRIAGALGFTSLSDMLGGAGDEPVAEEPTPMRRVGSAQMPASHAPVAQHESRWLPWALAIGLAALAIGFLFHRTGGRGAHLAGLPASVYFESGQAELDASGRQTLEAVADSLRARDSSVELQGYLERTKTGVPDLALAKERTAAVKEALVSQGVPDSKIVVKPPEIPPKEAARAQRVEITELRSQG